jgi:large subunit ribosomal protein L25
VSDFKLTAQPRSEFGKGAARRIRRDNKIPAVVYGHGTQPLHITLPGHETMLALKVTNALLEITLEGGSAEQKDILALAKDVQRDPVRRVIEHVDLVIVRRGEKVHVEIPVHVVGEAAGDTVVTVEHQALTVEAEATNLPENVEVSVDGLEAGTQILAGQVKLHEGSTLVTDPEALVVNVTAQVTAEAAEAELAEAEAEAGIEHEAPETKQEQPAEGVESQE